MDVDGVVASQTVVFVSRGTGAVFVVVFATPVTSAGVRFRLSRFAALNAVDDVAGVAMVAVVAVVAAAGLALPHFGAVPFGGAPDGHAVFILLLFAVEAVEFAWPFGGGTGPPFATDDPYACRCAHIGCCQ